MPHRPLHPDTATAIALNGTAHRLSLDPSITTAGATAQLREIAAGRTDLLAEECARTAATWLADPHATAHQLLAAAYLAVAGADPDSLPALIAAARARADQDVHGPRM